MHDGLHWLFGILAWYLSDKKWPYSFKQYEELLPLQYTIPYHPISSTGHEQLYSNIVSQVKMLQIILQLALWAANHLSFATWTLFSRCKAQFLWQDAQWLWLVRKEFVNDQWCYGRSNPGCSIVGWVIHHGTINRSKEYYRHSRISALQTRSMSPTDMSSCSSLHIKLKPTAALNLSCCNECATRSDSVINRTYCDTVRSRFHKSITEWTSRNWYIFHYQVMSYRPKRKTYRS